MLDWTSRAPPECGATIDADPIAAGPIARDDVKAYLRLATTDEDGLIDRLVATAVRHGEEFTGRLLLARGVRETIAAEECWRRLASSPVKSVTAVAALAADGTATALGAADYRADIDAGGDGWIMLARDPAASRLQVTLVAGMALGWATLPEPIRQAAVRLAAHLFTHRDAADEGVPPAAVAALWRPWRRMRIR